MPDDDDLSKRDEKIKHLISLINESDCDVVSTKGYGIVGTMIEVLVNCKNRNAFYLIYFKVKKGKLLEFADVH